jgi:acetyl/propionyl-CoA carboxylase alpha subunit
LRTYRAQVDDRTYVLSVESIRRDRFHVKLGDEVFEIESVMADEIPDWIIKSRGISVRARTRIMSNDRVDVYLGGLPFSVSLLLIGPKDYAPPAQKGVSGEIRALMPGRVTTILVNNGDQVEAGEALLILEAMKMQNEIASPVSGHVKSIRVKEGDAVKKDTVLIVLE